MNKNKKNSTKGLVSIFAISLREKLEKKELIPFSPHKIAPFEANFINWYNP